MQQLYLPLAHVALIVDNSDEGGGIIAERELDHPFVVRDAARWKMIQEATK